LSINTASYPRIFELHLHQYRCGKVLSSEHGSVIYELIDKNKGGPELQQDMYQYQIHVLWYYFSDWPSFIVKKRSKTREEAIRWLRGNERSKRMHYAYRVSGSTQHI